MIYKEIPIQLEDPHANAKLHMYLWDNSEEMNDGLLRPIILICPGGGYAMTSDREAEPLALKFMSMGYHAAVLRYSVAPAVYPAALLELGESVKIIRNHAKEWYIDSDKLILQGCSAGGHLAASLGVFWHEKFLSEKLKVESKTLKPNGMILCYPVITSKEYAHRESFQNLLGNSYDELVSKMSLEDRVSEKTPKTFIWHTFTDGTVPVENSLLFVQALRKYNISTEFHMYPVGKHGLSTAAPLTMTKEGLGLQEECTSWLGLVETWLKNI